MMEEKSEIDPNVSKLAPFNPSSDNIQIMAMDMLKLKENDVLFDIGCGDGRILIAAVKRFEGLQCVGVEIDPVFVGRARTSIEALPENLQSRLDIRLEDALQLPMILSEPDETTNDIANSSKSATELTLLDDATALYLFILPKGVEKLMPLLDALVRSRQKQGKHFRVVCYMFSVRSWEPTVVKRSVKGNCPIYLYEFNADKSAQD